MSEAVPRPQLAIPFAARLLLIGLGWLAFAGPARGSDCHEPGRPTFGLTVAHVRATDFPDSGSPGAKSVPVAGRTIPDQLRRAHCPGDQPGPSPRVGFSELFTIAPSPVDATAPPASLPVEAGRRRPPPRSPNPLERPPRPGRIDLQG